mmetsp:Transcript_32937/g.71278  ORF Transcript_32937/g.71278 Transcript_32937/m.71278 type:complete len:155 (-) Transcript_32937:465-929(-)|eukprot:CAMPEP_0178516626 /NCGR_PEP_ID=MMETSP0696-20121128/25219_1 /TAXON_ID=265572 /ORGANISM="Extubocellulus spinifer, Strain CCMP396" /LENGTH=154 /DNA_ID=CAMNT_0020146925 /DNA_START=41 /DNA_END=505 /DNA_ORIENTATION=+
MKNLRSVVLFLSLLLATCSTTNSATFETKLISLDNDGGNVFSNVRVEVAAENEEVDNKRALRGNGDDLDLLNQISQKRHRMLKSFSATVKNGGKKKKCKCSVGSVSSCKRCLGECCHDIKNGTKRCRHDGTNTCRKIFGKSSKGKYKRKKSRRN